MKELALELPGSRLDPLPYQVRTRTWEKAEEEHAKTVKLMARYNRMLAHHESVLAKMEKGL